MNVFETEFVNECQIGMKWKLKETDLKNNVQQIGLKSKIFKANIPGVKYCLMLYPNGKNENEPNKVKIFLHLLFGMAKKVIADFSISVNTAKRGIDFIYEIYDKSFGWGRTFCTRDDLFDPEKIFFVNGIMEIELEGTLRSRGIKRKSPESLSLAKMIWENEEQKDLIIVTGDQEIKVHKWIICAHSPVFKAEMESGIKESIERKIEITDFSFEIVKIFVEYCYERDIENFINEENVSELLHFTDKYDIQPLHNHLQQFMIQRLTEQNVCKFANASVSANAHALRECCICFLMKFVRKATVIDDSDELDFEICEEIGRRSFFSISK
uniref:BTB domain-containing protein n=1 Tax=Panagrolaimus davidi TaxID=227884 RepID=A0A914QQB2_9BILA